LPGSALTISSYGSISFSFKAFPAYERFELGSQIRRAAFSVAANIVEGFALPPGRRRVNFLRVAQASLGEVGYCVHVARRLSYISEAMAAELESEIKRTGAPLAGLIRFERTKAFSRLDATVLFVAALIAHVL